MEKTQANSTAIRKLQHVEICSSQEVESSDRFTGFERLSFLPNALPDLDLASVSLARKFLGRDFSCPILISGMTGGVENGELINSRLAAAAEHFSIPMGIGSQRVALENPGMASQFAMKRLHPKIFLIGNLGGCQLLASNFVDQCHRTIEMIGADALAIHLNVLQEMVQPEGDRKFANLIERIAEVCRKVRAPILVKEVGSGIDPSSAKKLYQAGVRAIDVGGRGGTAWGYIEGLRNAGHSTPEIANTFRDWGIPTAFALNAVAGLNLGCDLVATGGIRDGLMISKAIALGASMAGIGLPLLRAALENELAVFDLLGRFIKEIKITMVCTGSKNLDDLSSHLCWGHPLDPK